MRRGEDRVEQRVAERPVGVDASERDAWYDAMADAVRAGGLADDDEAAFLAYFEMAAATAMINHPGGVPG